MRSKGVHNVCPQCRGEITDANQRFHEGCCLLLRAEHLLSKKQTNELLRLSYLEFQQAAAVDPKHAEAYYQLFDLCRDEREEADGTALQNIIEAKEWATKAAELGHPKAQHAIARIYFCGIGVNKDVIQAAQWYTKAAENGHAMAQVT
jgi:TPR repeat protein